ncbi:MAG: putative CRISPR-associated protein [Candidatus Methanomethyliaceae archaeon]|nr:putative CRISPR-associated protein [Candidatus Methanomethyliaceae archaeon]MDW7971440.1 putative CRISPR-associated protein [Nitrososphaerota archaeon]
MDVHLITVGTSILRNFVDLKDEEAFINKHKMKDWHKIDPEDDRQKKIESLAFRGNEVFEKLLEYVNKRPKEASAELNAFYAFNRLSKPSDVEVYLYSTETGTGWLCANVLYYHLNDKGFKVQQPIKLKGFGKGILSFDEALLEVIDKVVRLIKSKKNQGFRVFINATAGFKPESAFMVIASMLAGADQAYYIHEAFKEIVAIPLLPLVVEPKYVEALKFLKEPLPRYMAKESLMYKGLDLDDLRDRGLIKEGEYIMLREWVRKLLES